jgi:hypothetical protein
MLENGDFSSFMKAISYQQGKLFTQVKIVINTKFHSFSSGMLRIGLIIQLEILKICSHYFLIQNQISTSFSSYTNNPSYLHCFLVLISALQTIILVYTPIGYQIVPLLSFSIHLFLL